MFTRARFKLTGWYLLIIMFISLAFSTFIYRTVSREIDRIAESQRFRFERRIFVQFPDVWQYTEPEFDEEIITESKRHLFYNLTLINGAIFAMAGILGYYLAGRTLQPIQEMVHEQYRFISDASHELKTPLTSMRSALEVNLRAKKMTAKEARSVLEDNLVEVIDLQNLSENLLELSSRHQLGNIESISIKNVLTSAIDKIRPLAQAKKIKLIFSSKKDFLVKGDSSSLVRAMVAILDNAVKYSKPKKSVKIFLTSSKKYAEVAITDQGIGISKENIPHLTERFYRADQARVSSGFGLGLAIVQKIIDAHHGKIDIKSKFGSGTTVLISLPISGIINNQSNNIRS